jgi:hypothetical protein
LRKAIGVDFRRRVDATLAVPCQGDLHCMNDSARYEGRLEKDPSHEFGG